MNKTILRVILTVVVSMLLLLLLFRNTQPFGKGNTSFASQPQKEITRIEFSQGKQRIVLEKNGENWLINGKSETRKSGVFFILRILNGMKIKSPVSRELFDSEISAKNIVPVKVRVYEKRKLIKSFLVYKTRSNNFGNIMKMRDGAKPFIVYVPGNEGDIGSAFTLNELFWQPFTVFNLLPSEIESVDVENFSDTSSSFLITRKDNSYLLDRRPRNLAGWDSSQVTRYLSYFTFIPFESWASEMGAEEQNDIKARLPIYRITVNTVNKKQTILTLWAKISLQDGSETIDTDRLLGKTDERNDLFIIRYFDIDPLLKKRSYFFSK